MIDEIVPEIHGDTERLSVTVHWAGGDQTEVVIKRPVATWEQLSNFDELREFVEQLFEKGLSHNKMVDRLNQTGYYPPRNEQFTRGSLTTLLSRLDLQRNEYPTQTEQLELDDDEWTIQQLASELDMPRPTLYGWVRRGDVSAEQWSVKNRGIWVITADETTLKQLRERRRNRSR